MTLTPYPVEEFGGLVLTADPQESGPTGALSLLNVAFSPGRVRTRGGYVAWSANTYLKLAYWTDPVNATIFACNATDTVALNRATGAASVTYAGHVFTDSVNFSTPTVDYIVFGKAVGEFFRFDTPSLAFSSPTVTVDGVAGRVAPKGAVLGKTTKDNRLIVANTGAGGGPHSAASSTDHVWWSDPGLMDSWSTNNYLIFSPGRTYQGVTATENFRNQTIIFKRDCFGVFHDTQTSATGSPSFPYTLYNGVGCVETNAVTAAPSGIFFVGEDGIYLTQGYDAQKISGALDPMFGIGDLPNGSSFTPLTPGSSRSLSYFEGRLYFACSAGTFVYEIASQRWSVYSVTMYQALFPTGVASPTAGLYFLSATTATTIKRHSFDNTLTDDAGTPIASHIQSGFYELAPGQEAFTRWTRLWGTGSPTVDIFTDQATSDPLSRGGVVTLGTSPAVEMGYHLKAYQGRQFSHKISSTSGVWSLSKIQHDIAHVR